MCRRDTASCPQRNGNNRIHKRRTQYGVKRRSDRLVARQAADYMDGFVMYSKQVLLLSRGQRFKG